MSFSPARIERQGYFNPKVVERLKLQYMQEGFHLNLPFEQDLLAIVLTFGIFLDFQWQLILAAQDFEPGGHRGAG